MELLAALAVVALLVRVGFALYAAGLVRAKNSASSAMRAIADLCISVLAFWAIGSAFLIHFNNPWLSVNSDLLFGRHSEQAHFSIASLFLYFAMILTATSAVSGAVAERLRFVPLCIASAVLAGFVLPVAAHWAWSGDGWLNRRGFIDLAGGCALHVSAGVFAAVGAAIIGPRTGKYNRDGSSSMIPGHNIPLAAVGALVMLVGWSAYVGAASAIWQTIPDNFMGVVAAKAGLNVLLSAAAAGFASMIVGQIRYGKPDVLLVLTGFLGGLVSICAAGAVVPTWAAVVIGMVGGTIVSLAVVRIDLRLRLDDPLGMIAIHAVAGAWGTIAAGLFIPTPATASRLSQVGIQLVGLALIVLFSAVVAVCLFLILRATVGLRAKEIDEFDGLDLAEHDIGAYPDFQQNSIKSYHLRET